MSYFSDTLKTLLNWEIYSSNDDFKKFVIENNLSEKEQKTLIEAYKKLYAYQESGALSPQDAPIIDQALELKNRFKQREYNRKQQVAEDYSDPSGYVRITESEVEKEKSIEMEDANFEKLEFRGGAKEYFKIWIVNIFLTLITAGIYSAWAKVRTNRYFYANTFFQNSSFEYTADPLKILKGRIIVVAIYALFIVASQILLNPIMTGVILVFALLIAPWIINRAIKFKLKNSKYRNIRFHYDENAPAFYKFYAIHGVLNLLTLGLAFPYSLNAFKKLLIDNSQYGSSNFSYAGKSGEMYKEFMKIIGGYIGYVIIPFFLAGFFASILARRVAPLESIDPALLPILMVAFSVVIYSGYIFAAFMTKGIYDAYIANYSFSQTSLKQSLFKSTLSPSKLGWIYLSNIFLIIFSLGLLAPFAKVRIVKYKCDNFAIYAPDIDQFIEASYVDESAIGEEAEDFFDVDIGI